MGFEVIPAVDVARGKLARLEGGRAVRVSDFGGDPSSAAAAFIVAGARWLHVVDMDLAREGLLGNAGILRAICRMSVNVQVSGGFAAADEIELALEAGAARVVLGSGALADRELTESLVGSYGERLAVALEVQGDAILPRRGGSPLPLRETVSWLMESAASRFVHTDLKRVGGLGGPDLEGISRIRERSHRPLLVAGGIASLGDLEALAAIGVEGAIVGRALYDGRIRPADAAALRS